MAKPLNQFFSRLRRRVAPTATAGVPGTALFGGFIQDNERNVNLSSRVERFKTYSEILANTSIAAAGVRYFLNLVAKAEWTFKPSETDRDGRFAEAAERALKEDPATPWHRIVRRAAMYRFYGFSVQEWTMKRGDDGGLTYKDVAPRAQLTLERWDTAEDGEVLGVLQHSPQTQRDIYLPRGKLFYLVDDSLSDSPEGFGLFRHLVAPAQRLARYEQLEGFGFETDLRGVPIGRGPFSELARLQDEGDLSKAQRAAIEAPLRTFVEKHVKDPKLGLLLDSLTYQTSDEAGRPSQVRLWDIELLKGSSVSFRENAAAIERLNREIGRILGVEQLMLGADSAGSFALSRDKTGVFFLLIDSALTEIRESVKDDLLGPLWRLNGWPEEAMPELDTEAVRFTDAEAVATTLRDMAAAGAILEQGDPVIGEVRGLLGVSKQDDDDAAVDAALVPAEPADDE